MPSDVQMAFLMSGASYLSPSTEVAKEQGLLQVASSMLKQCRDAHAKLQKRCSGMLPADAAKMQLYLDLQVCTICGISAILYLLGKTSPRLIR